MSPGKNNFKDDFEESLREAANMSDVDLERMMMGADAGPAASSLSPDQLESGERLEGVVVEVQSREILVELDGKTIGVIDIGEYEDDQIPGPGERIGAEFVRHDSSRDICILTTKAVRTEIAWDELNVGMTLEGTVVETNRGGLTLDIKGMRAFMPISQIDRERVEDTEKYVGRKFVCEVIQLDRGENNLVVSRRVILDREGLDQRREALDQLKVGEVIYGRIVRLTEHGAFIDLGGVDGLLHASKIARQVQSESSREALEVGASIEVEIASIDRERERVGLDFRSIDETAWDTLIEGYEVGDEVTGWVSRIDKDGAVLSIEEGLEAIIPADALTGSVMELETGAIVKAIITSINLQKEQLTVRPRQ